MAGGSIRLMDGSEVLADVPLPAGVVLNADLRWPVFGGIATRDGEPTEATMVDAAGDEVVGGLVVGKEVEIDRASVYAGQNVVIQSLVIRHP